MHGNKAHTAAANRIAKRYHGTYNRGSGFDIQTDLITVEVETSATISDGVRRLVEQPGRVYVAVTNKDSISEALRSTEGTRVGVMDPYGEIVREADSFPSAG